MSEARCQARLEASLRAPSAGSAGAWYGLCRSPGIAGQMGTPPLRRSVTTSGLISNMTVSAVVLMLGCDAAWYFELVTFARGGRLHSFETCPGGCFPGVVSGAKIIFGLVLSGTALH